MLDDMVAVVTGASGGIGEGIARMLAAEGVAVALAARREEELIRVASEIREAGGRAHVYPTNVRADAELTALVERAEQALGPIDILVNNAGVARNQPIHDLVMKHWDLVMDVNLRAPTYLCRSVLPGMRERGRGFIVNIASEAGSFIVPGMGAYTVSKNGLRVLTELIDRENFDLGIKAWAICPGMVDTEMGAAMPGGVVENYLQVSDVADLVRFLLHQDPNVRMGPVLTMRTMRNPFRGGMTLT